MHPLIRVEQLQSILGSPNVIVIDCRHDLAQPAAGRATYEASHILGARFMHLDEDLSGLKTGQNGRHPLPDPEVLAEKLGQLGVSAQSRVVAYDASGGPFAARLWWLLRWLGCEQVQVLDGGWQAWIAADGAVSNQTSEWPPQIFFFSPQHALHVSVNEVLANLSAPQFQLVDARSAERFIGQGETIDPIAGHIPGAINRFFMLNLLDGHFKSPEQLQAEWQAVLDTQRPEQIVHQCGSGVTACHNLLALAVAGLDGGRLYPGSWSEWCSDPARPMLC